MDLTPQPSTAWSSRLDAAVIGAGPVGCVVALALAQRGRRVVLLEGNPRSARRLAGEWIHPAGVQVLERLGLHDLVRHWYTVRGFAVFPQDGSTPIVLQYPDGKTGLTREHFDLVDTLRHAAAAHANIQLVEAAQATAIDGQRLHFKTADHSPHTVSADLIVGADGRSSLARKYLGLADRRTDISSMAGILLDDVDLLHDGYGQVLLGGPGPILASPIGPRRVRLFLDLPPGKTEKDTAFLWHAFEGVVHRCWREPFRRALENRQVVWAANQWRPRLHYGRPGLALVGDAVGHYHPLTAVGLTLGFLDAACLAESRSFAEYRRQRTAHCGVPQLLADSLYKAFTNDDPGSLAVRGAIFRAWRQCPAECRRTMRLLSGEEIDIGHFQRAFVRVLTLALQGLLQDALAPKRWRQVARTLSGFTRWLHWLASDHTQGQPVPS